MSVDDEAIRVFHSSGMRKDIVMPSEDINQLCLITHMNAYVGWKLASPDIYVRAYLQLLHILTVTLPKVARVSAIARVLIAV
mgnify:CR=1 FL=1